MNTLTVEQRDYQTEAPVIIVESLKENKRALIVMATGLGKTITCGLTLEEYFNGTPSFRALYLCDRSLSLDQAEKEFFEKLNIKAKPARFYGPDKAKGSHDRSIVFASFQKLGSALEWYKQFDRNHFDLVIVDEAHHAFAPTYHSIINYFKSDSCPLLGMTATPYRFDQKDIEKLFGPPVVSIGLEEGIVMGWLAELEYLILSDDLDDEKLKKIIDSELKGRKNKPTITSLNSTLFIRKRDDEIVRHVKYHTQQGKKTLIFCQSIAQADQFTYLLGPAAREFHSQKGHKHNEEALREFKGGPIKYLLTVDKLNEAFDMPEVEVVVFLRSTESRRIFFQQLGRGLRKTQTKRKVLVLDFVSNCERLMYLATLANNIKVASDKKFAKLIGKDSEYLKRNAEPGSEFEIFFKSSDQQLSPPTNVYEPSNIMRPRPKNEPIYFTIEGTGFSFTFTEKVIEIMKLMKMIKEGFYPTWQEASAVAISAGIRGRDDYRKQYEDLDIRLPSNPETTYKDFPGWAIFLQTNRKSKESPRSRDGFYQTWQEARVAIRKLKINSWREYVADYIKDEKLPSNPARVYSDFPGWLEYLGTHPYDTWQDVVVAAKQLGIKGGDEYRKRYSEDPRLRAHVPQLYPGFPGWKTIFAKK